MSEDPNPGLIDRLVPARLRSRDPDTARGARLLAWMIVITAPLAFFYTVWFVTHGRPNEAVLAFVGGLLGFGALLVMRWSRSVSMTGAYVALILIGSVTAHSISREAFIVHNLIWTLPIPLCAVLLRAGRWTYLWLGIIFVQYAGIYLLFSDPGRSGHSPPHTELTSMLFILGIVGAVAVFYQMARARAERERKALEARLLKAQKMDTLGRFAGGVAHDFNNLLTVIQNAAALNLAKSDPAVRRDLEAIIEAARSGEDLTRQILLFTGGHTFEREVFDLNALLQANHALLRRLLKDDIALALDLIGAPLHVKSARSQIEQVVLNLAANAQDAMPNGGRLEIRTKRVELSEPQAGAAPGPYARLDVTDTGIGIAPDKITRIFEPFFTTKGRARGTGLGLSTAYGIIRGSGGSLHVESIPGKGSTFQVYLPLSAEMPEPAAPPTEAPEPEAATVLIIEDNEKVRELTARGLEAEGYRVHTAKDARTARTIWEANPGQIDLLITDVVLPDESGPDFVRDLAARHEGMRVLFMSGYAEKALDLKEVPVEASFLQKPFLPDEFLDAIAKLLVPSRAER